MWMSKGMMRESARCSLASGQAHSPFSKSCATMEPTSILSACPSPNKRCDRSSTQSTGAAIQFTNSYSSAIKTSRKANSSARCRWLVLSCSTWVHSKVKSTFWRTCWVEIWIRLLRTKLVILAYTSRQGASILISCMRSSTTVSNTKFRRPRLN